jgi:hypothetical protein
VQCFTFGFPLYLDNILVSPCIVILYMVDLYKPAFQLLNETYAKHILEKKIFKNQPHLKIIPSSSTGHNETWRA